MTDGKRYFFCGIGGSGMLPLAMILRARGADVAGSDRSRDQGRFDEKFKYLEAAGITLYPQDGSGLTSPSDTLVASAAVEDTVPDVAAALRAGASRMTRAQLLADIFNASDIPIGVAGTSGKSTTTAMAGWILHDNGGDPTIMNGAVMKNFVAPDALFASAAVGGGAAFVSEIDESDGSIAMFNPKIAILNNVALDHKSMEELRDLFGGYIERSSHAILNLDNDETRQFAGREICSLKSTFSIIDRDADYFGDTIVSQQSGVGFDVIEKSSGVRCHVDLKMPGRHNVSNALGAIAASIAAGVDVKKAAASLSAFAGVKRRLEYVGEANGITVIDDFAHNPDKISASLTTLCEFPGRLLVMFQPHGYGPLKKMGAELIAAFADHLRAGDMLVMPPPVYFGGTVDRSVSSDDIVAGVVAGARDARALASRDACGELILQTAQPGDRIIVMGARDDSLSEFARQLLSEI